jgi:RNA polymerase sigma factor (sigma-70 family)
VDEQLAWRSLGGSNEVMAERALAILQKRYMPALHAYLRNTGVSSADDRDDLISKAFIKLWAARKRINFPSDSAGRSYLFTIVNRCMVDAIRDFARTRTVSVEMLHGTDDEPTSCESPEALVYARVISAQLMTAANCLWLGLDSSLLPATHTRQLLAAQLFYLENCTLEEIVLQLQPARPPGEPTLTIAVLETWLNHAGVIRLLAYEQLCYDSARLLNIVLGIRKLTPDLISNLWHCARSSPPDAPAIDELSWAAVAVAIMRYQLAISFDEVAAARNEVVRSWGYSQPQILALLETVRSRLPFSRDVEALLDRLECHARMAKSRHHVLALPDVWQRLAFQYSYIMDLAQKDTLERVQPAAGTAGYRLAESTLNVWISGKRLQKRLLKYWQEHYGDPELG